MGMINALQVTDTLLSGLNAGYSSALGVMSDYRRSAARQEIVHAYNNLVDRYNELSLAADRATRKLQLEAVHKDMEIANLKAEIAHLRGGKKS